MGVIRTGGDPFEQFGSPDSVSEKNYKIIWSDIIALKEW